MLNKNTSTPVQQEHMYFCSTRRDVVLLSKLRVLSFSKKTCVLVQDDVGTCAQLNKNHGFVMGQSACSNIVHAFLLYMHTCSLADDEYLHLC